MFITTIFIGMLNKLIMLFTFTCVVNYLYIIFEEKEVNTFKFNFYGFSHCNNNQSNAKSNF